MILHRTDGEDLTAEWLARDMTALLHDGARVWHRYARLLGTDGLGEASHRLWMGPGVDGVEYVYLKGDDRTPIHIATLQPDGRVSVEVAEPASAYVASHPWIRDSLEEAFPVRIDVVGT